jgi:hypothetical protein
LNVRRFEPIIPENSPFLVKIWLPLEECDRLPPTLEIVAIFRNYFTINPTSSIWAANAIFGALALPF